MNKVLASELRRIKDSLTVRYETHYGCFYAPYDEEALETCSRLATTLKAYNPTIVVLVGIGGSNLGALAVLQALYGVLHNERSVPRFYCADTIDNDETGELYTHIEQELAKGATVILCIVTKSGSTTETLINGSLFYDCLRRYRPLDFHNFVVVITDEQSPLMHVAQKNKCHLLTIPSSVGGRYSVFSAVGLFPLCLMGVDIRSFVKGAQRALDENLHEDLEHSEVAKQAVALYNAYNAGYLIHDIFVFCPALVMLGHWYKQLIGESLGKKHDIKGNLVEIGISPTVSEGTVDLHSVVQLYLAGPRIRTTTFLVKRGESSALTIPSTIFTDLVPGLAGRSVTFIKDAIFEGVIQAYKREERPYSIASLEEGSSESLGAFMMEKMLETVLLGALFSINPFDQPAVELYKEGARARMRSF